MQNGPRNFQEFKQKSLNSCGHDKQVADLDLRKGINRDRLKMCEYLMHYNSL